MHFQQYNLSSLLPRGAQFTGFTSGGPKVRESVSKQKTHQGQLGSLGLSGVRFGHGHGDHFHPQPPFEVYGQSNPFFQPLAQAMFRLAAGKGSYKKFVQAWLLNPEMDGLNNLKSLHLLVSPAGVAQTWEALPMLKKPRGIRLTIQNAWVHLLSRTPFTRLRLRVQAAYQQEKNEMLTTLQSKIKEERVLPILEEILKPGGAGWRFRAVAARILIWDYLAAQKDPSGKEVSSLVPAFQAMLKPEPTVEAQAAYQKEVSKFLAVKDYAWPHDAYLERHPNAHEQKGTGAGHSHDKMMTVHREEGWDTPHYIALEVATGLRALPLPRRTREQLGALLGDTPPTDWARHLFELFP